MIYFFNLCSLFLVSLLFPSSLVPVSQLQELLDVTDATLELCTPDMRLRLQDQQQEVVGNWERLRLHMDQREAELKLTRQRYLFLNTVN